MGKIKYIILTLAIITGFGIAILPETVGAANVFDACNGNNDPICTEATADGKLTAFVKVIVDTLFYILGAVAVIVIILSGISYVTSTGDPGAITKAKSTLTYAVIGLVVAMLAYAIVNFVIVKTTTVTPQTKQSSTKSGTQP